MAAWSISSSSFSGTVIRTFLDVVFFDEDFMDIYHISIDI